MCNDSEYHMSEIIFYGDAWHWLNLSSVHRLMILVSQLCSTSTAALNTSSYMYMCYLKCDSHPGDMAYDKENASLAEFQAKFDSIVKDKRCIKFQLSPMSWISKL